MQQAGDSDSDPHQTQIENITELASAVRDTLSPICENVEDSLKPPADVTDLAKVLKTEQGEGEGSFIVRKGNASDVFGDTKDQLNLEGKLVITDLCKFVRLFSC